MEIICIKKKLIKAIAEIFFKMGCFFPPLYIYIYIFIGGNYLTIFLKIFIFDVRKGSEYVAA